MQSLVVVNLFVAEPDVIWSKPPWPPPQCKGLWVKLFVMFVLRCSVRKCKVTILHGVSHQECWKNCLQLLRRALILFPQKLLGTTRFLLYLIMDSKTMLLLSVAVQEMRLSMECEDPDVQLCSIKCDSYPRKVVTDAQTGSVDITHLYADEVEDILLSSTIAKSNEQTSLLRVACAYKDPVTNVTIRIQGDEVKIRRPISTVYVQVSIETDREGNCLRAANSIESARAAAERGALSEAFTILEDCRRSLSQSVASQNGDHFCMALDAKLREMQERMVNRQLYEASGRAYMLYGLSSHSWQMEALLRSGCGEPPIVKQHVVEGAGTGIVVDLAYPTKLVKCRLQPHRSLAEAATASAIYVVGLRPLLWPSFNMVERYSVLYHLGQRCKLPWFPSTQQLVWCVPATALQKLLTCIMVLSESMAGYVLVQELVQRKCGGNCRCFLLEGSPTTEAVIAKVLTDTSAECFVNSSQMMKGFYRVAPPALPKDIARQLSKKELKKHMIIRFLWYPGGSDLLHRLGSKSHLKKGAMSGITHGWAVIWVMGLDLGIAGHWPRPQAITYKSAGAPAGGTIKQQNTKQAANNAAAGRWPVMSADQRPTMSVSNAHPAGAARRPRHSTHRVFALLAQAAQPVPGTFPDALLGDVFGVGQTLVHHAIIDFNATAKAWLF